MDILDINQLEKGFGTHKIIENINFSVPEHSIFGFIGQNGAGKTTTMKMILGLLKADSGTITVCGEQVTYGQTKTNKNIGYLPDVPEFYGYMKPKEYLKLCGEITGLSPNTIKNKSEELLSLVGLEKENKKIGGFSRGMKQRLGIAQALLNEPKLLICDEPTSALDPIGRKEILSILQQLKGKTTVMFSTHILSDVERICDRIAVLHKGNIMLSGTISEIKAKNKKEGLLIEFSSLSDKEVFIQSGNMGNLLTSMDNTENSVVLHHHEMKGIQLSVMELLAKLQIAPVKLEVLEPTLESLFMEVVQ